MLTIEPHTFQDYAVLPNMDGTDVGILTERDHACLAELGDCLIRANAHTRFGATLLHSHFPIHDGETLVEEVASDLTSITLQPRRYAACGLAATNVCFQLGEISSEHVRLVGLEFTQSLCSVSPISDLDSDNLSRFAQVLKRHGMLRRFGVRLLHDPLQLNGRVLLETCDEAERVLSCTICSRDGVDFKHSVATVFRWEMTNDQNDKNWTINQGCMQFC
jgi:hypothetical protein